MDEALGRAGDDHKLEVISGGGHYDKTFGPGLMKALQWFKEKLLNEEEPEEGFIGCFRAWVA